MKLKEMWRENIKHREEGVGGWGRRPRRPQNIKKNQERIKRRARAKKTSWQNS